MFNEVNGLPVHILVVHAAVVFVPLLAIGAVLYALVGRWRPRLGWAVALLAVVAPVTALFAKLSGTELFESRFQSVKGRGAEILHDHQGYGDLTFWFSLALGLVALGMVALHTRRPANLPRAVDLVVAVVVVALGLASGYYVVKTGDSGATAVWGSY